jgi:hypothetical protein
MRSHTLFWAIDLLLLGAPVVLKDQIPIEVGYLMWGAAAVLTVYWLATNWRLSNGTSVFSELVPQWGLQFRFNDVVPFRRTIPLDDAGRYAVDQTAEFYIGRAARELSDGNAVNWLITNLAMPKTNEDKAFPGPLRLYGRLPGSTRRVLVPLRDREAGFIRDEGTTLRQSGSDKVMYTHLEILRSEMKKRIRYLKRLSLD